MSRVSQENICWITSEETVHWQQATEEQVDVVKGFSSTFTVSSYRFEEDSGYKDQDEVIRLNCRVESREQAPAGSRD